MKWNEFYTWTPIPYDATSWKLKAAATQSGCTKAEILGCLALIWKWAAAGNAGKYGELLYADLSDVANVIRPLITDAAKAETIVQALVDNEYLRKVDNLFFIDIWPTEERRRKGKAGESK